MRMTLEQVASKWADSIVKRYGITASDVASLKLMLAAGMSEWHLEALVQHIESKNK